MPSHNTNDCCILKDHIQDLIDSRKIEDPEKKPNVKTNPLPNYRNMPPPVSYSISSRLPKSFIENSIQDILESEMERFEREERELLVILKADLVDIVWQESIPKSEEEGKEESEENEEV